jgi:hypothetical protein
VVRCGWSGGVGAVGVGGQVVEVEDDSSNHTEIIGKNPEKIHLT